MINHHGRSLSMNLGDTGSKDYTFYPYNYYAEVSNTTNLFHGTRLESGQKLCVTQNR